MIRVKNLAKIYNSHGVETRALEDVSFEIKAGEFVAIMGPSGSGKSTLMHILGGLDLATAGSYELNGEDISRMEEDELADIRNKNIGFVFQAYNLLPRTTALKNVMLPMIYAGLDKEERQRRAEKFLKLVGLEERMDHNTNQLSGGEQQRVAIARALSMDPKLILADEPTGNLATAQGEEIMDIFKKLNKAGHTIVMITHESNIAEHAKRVISIRDGRIVGDKRNGHKLREGK